MRWLVFQLLGSCSGIESTCYNEIHEIAIDEQENGEIMLPYPAECSPPAVRVNPIS